MRHLILVFIIVFYCCNTKKTEIVDQLFLYRDSLGVANVQLFLTDTAREDGVSEEYIFNMRKPIKERIYRYNWKLDSLELELKKY